jgi:hypothetical protein
LQLTFTATTGAAARGALATPATPTPAIPGLVRIPTLSTLRHVLAILVLSLTALTAGGTRTRGRSIHRHATAVTFCGALVVGRVVRGRIRFVGIRKGIDLGST